MVAMMIKQRRCSLLHLSLLLFLWAIVSSAWSNHGQVAAFGGTFSSVHGLTKQATTTKTTQLGMAQSDNDGNDENDNNKKTKKERLPLRRAFLLSGFLAATQYTVAQAYAPPGFKRIPTQFIAALGDPNASSGTEAKDWGLWRLDPGPRGVFLKDFGPTLEKHNGKAPAGWTFNKNDWWLEEHGLIMEAPDFPLSAGRYLVTGGRLVTTVLTVTETGGWSLENGKLYDVTHLPCRSARYKPNGGDGSPLTANQRDFPVMPGAEMPKVEGCDKQDYAVLFVIGMEAA